MPSPTLPPSPLQQAAAFLSRFGDRVRNGLRRRLGPNGDLMVLSVLIAIVLIRLIRPIAVGERTFSVPVSVASTSPSSTVVGVSPASVIVTLRGPVKSLEAFYGPGLSLPLSSANPGRHRSETLPFEAGDLRGVDDRLRVVGMSTNAVRVSYDNLRAWTITEKNLAPPQIEGAPLEGVATASVAPGQTFTISGSEKRTGEFVQKGIRLPLEPISVEGKIDGFEAAVPIRIPAESGITSVAPSNALVRVTIVLPASTVAPVPVALPVDPGEKPLLPAPDEPEGEPVEIVDDPVPPPAEFPEDDEPGDPEDPEGEE